MQVLDNFECGTANVSVAADEDDCPLSIPVVIGLRAAFVGTMIATFPTISYGLRTSLHALAFPSRDESAAFRWAEAAILVAVAVAVAVAVDDLGLVFQLAGSTCANVVSILLPAALHLRARRPSAAAPAGRARAADEDEEEPPAVLSAVALGRMLEDAFAWLAITVGGMVLFFVFYDHLF